MTHIFILLQIEQQGFSLIQKIADPILAILLFSLSAAVVGLWRSTRDKNVIIQKLQDSRYDTLIQFQREKEKEIAQQHSNILAISDSTRELVMEFKQVINTFIEKENKSIQLHEKNSELLMNIGTKIEQIKRRN